MTEVPAGPDPLDRLHRGLVHHIVNFSLDWPGLRPLREEAIAPLMDGADTVLLASGMATFRTPAANASCTSGRMCC